MGGGGFGHFSVGKIQEESEGTEASGKFLKELKLHAVLHLIKIKRN